MKIEIHSGKPIGEERFKMIRDIFTYSQCPNESLRNSVEGFTSFDGKVLQLDEGDDYIYSIEIAGKK